MPADFPHWRTVYDVADGWHKSGATAKMHDEVRRQCRIAAGRKPEPTAAMIDSQSVKAAEEVSRASRGYDAGKKRPDDLHTFQVLPRRWVVERTLAWITRCRRTVRDYERLPEHHETIVYWAMTITMTRRLAGGQHLSRPLLGFQTGSK
jgi:transposase